MSRHISCLIILSFACMRSRRVFLLIWNLPWRVLPQMKVKPTKLKVSGLPSPRRWRRSAAKRPNSMSRVFSGCSVSANFSNRVTHLVQEAAGVALVLEADYKVIGVAHNDHVARDRALAPANGPQIERVV